MGNDYEAGPGRADRASSGYGRVAAFVVAFFLAIWVLPGFGALSVQEADAAIYPADETAQVDDQSDQGEPVDDEAAGEEGESIEDDETPMSSGLGGGEPISSGGAGFVPIALTGIAAVAVFFFVLMRRLNGSIRDMNSMFK